MLSLYRWVIGSYCLVAFSCIAWADDGIPKPVVVVDVREQMVRESGERASPTDEVRVRQTTAEMPANPQSDMATSEPVTLPVSYRISDDSIVETMPSASLGHETTSEFAGSHCDEYCTGICRDPGRPRKPCLTKPGDRDWGDCPPLRYRMNDHRRAGKPLCYHRFSIPSITCKYSAGWVGGGTPCFGRSQCADEGTWGLDYGGFFGHAHNWLRWTKHHRYQGGEGAYKTDGRTKLVGLFKK